MLTTVCDLLVLALRSAALAIAPKSSMDAPHRQVAVFSSQSCGNFSLVTSLMGVGAVQFVHCGGLAVALGPCIYSYVDAN
jgi:hypothetical protein